MYKIISQRCISNQREKELNKEKLSNFWIQRTCDTKSLQ